MLVQSSYPTFFLRFLTFYLPNCTVRCEMRLRDGSMGCDAIESPGIPQWYWIRSKAVCYMVHLFVFKYKGKSGTWISIGKGNPYAPHVHPGPLQVVEVIVIGLIQQASSPPCHHIGIIYSKIRCKRASELKLIKEQRGYSRLQAQWWGSSTPELAAFTGSPRPLTPVDWRNAHRKRGVKVP